MLKNKLWTKFFFTFSKKSNSDGRSVKNSWAENYPYFDRIHVIAYTT